MKKYSLLIRRNLLIRFLVMMTFVVMLVIAGAFYLYSIQTTEKEGFTQARTEIVQKQTSISGISQHTTKLFHHILAYYTYQSKEEYSHIFDEKALVENELNQFRQYQLTSKEVNFLERIETFLESYFSVTLPEITEIIKSNNYKGLSKAEQEDRSTKQLDDLLEELYIFDGNYKSLLEQEKIRLDKHLEDRDFKYILYVMLILLLQLILMIKIARDFGIPIVRLADSAKAFMNGQEKPVSYTKRSDEIGLLARSLEKLMLRIRAKEEELVAQNEELIAQQDELHMQQDELTKTIANLEDKEHILQQQNHFINSISNTLDRNELLNSVIHSVIEIMHADKGLLLLTDMSSHVSFGLSDRAIQQFIENYNEDIGTRLNETRKLYQINRQMTSQESGYHLEVASVSDMYVPVFDANNKVIAVLVVSRISAEFNTEDEGQLSAFAKQIGLSLEKLNMYDQAESQRVLTQNMMDTIDVGVQLLDLNGTTIQVNSSWNKMMSFVKNDDTSIHLTFKQFKEGLNSLVKEGEPLLQFIRSLVYGQVFSRHELTYEMTSPQQRVIKLSSEPLYIRNNRIGTLLIYRDITKEYEADLMKSEFVSTVSHELRTPLASVLGFAELLLHKEMNIERQKKYIRTIHQEASRLTLLINDFLDLQRMESGKQTYLFSSVNLAQLIEEVLESQKVSAPNHTFEFINDCGQNHVNIDGNKMKQVLVNVISNAVKYSPRGGKVKVELRAEDNYMYIHITDEGLGIPLDNLPLLFQKFYRVDNSDRREIGGTGLGLAIVKEIMERHSGDVEVHSVYGQGSTFTLRLPYVVEGEKLMDVSSDRNQQVVYIIEDDANLSNLLTEELKSNSYRVVQFTSGERALQAMLSDQPDAVIVDIILTPGLNGWDVVEKMKEHTSLADVPILISSAFEEAERAVELGARGYLLKPYYPQNLSDALLKILNNNGAKGMIYVPDSSSREEGNEA